MEQLAQHGQRRYIELTVTEAMHALQSPHCPACSESKTPGSPLCHTDYLALPLHMRGFTQRGPDDPNFVEYYRRALQHLRDFPTRRVRILSRGGAWSFTNFDDLDRAGYRFLEHTRCAVPSCRARITLYRTPNLRKIAVNYDKCIPHADTCTDPGYFARMRAVRTSAKRKRRA